MVEDLKGVGGVCGGGVLWVAMWTQDLDAVTAFLELQKPVLEPEQFEKIMRFQKKHAGKEISHRGFECRGCTHGN